MSLPSQVKSFIKNLPVLGPYLTHQRQESAAFKSSSDYWDKRYNSGGNSGSGSYNRLAEFKAEFLNDFVAQNHITSVIEHGSGDGAQLKLARYPAYTGVDVSPKAVELCRTLFSTDMSKQFLEARDVPADFVADLSLSLDVIYHLVEDNVFNIYMQSLFATGRRFVVIYSSNRDERWPDSHVRHREFTRWIESNKPEWRLTSSVKNAYPYDPENPAETSFADFYVFATQ